MKLSNSSLFVSFITLLCLGYLIYLQANSKDSKLPYMFIIALSGIIYIYAINCLSNGDCNIFSWFIAILIIFYQLLLTFLIAKIPFDILLKIQLRSDYCTFKTIRNDPEISSFFKKI
jgi:hypothetical protein